MAPQTQSSSPDTSSQQQFISFLLNDGIWGMIPTTQLTETVNLELGTIIQIPDLPPAVIGVCGWRGEVLWLVDLSYALGLPPLLSTDYQSAKCNVLKVTVNQQSFGILVAEVRQLVRCDRQHIQGGIPSSLKLEAADQLVDGFYAAVKDIQILNIDLASLLDMLRSPT